ncbi:hypothetical protein SAMN05661010_00089 [Modicisalibacter muralis]|uniref:DUF2188 domain-containing protein n=1 Tax=Modicisalibacter muralis TaxID=119000 RepID=A0A1G9ERR9_9GAMM|nr:DUF2188 domain-containing protein [Halomonas muralis]SDK78829.1 hypothetical protein SAMN05661010_00089 [Halomonas muralis]
MDNYHISKDGETWKFQKTGSDRAIKRSGTKAEVVDYMREYMDGKTGSVKIHKEDGTIQEERTYPRGADPRRTPG